MTFSVGAPATGLEAEETVALVDPAGTEIPGTRVVLHVTATSVEAAKRCRMSWRRGRAAEGKQVRQVKRRRPTWEDFATEEEIAEMIKSADTNGDGKIDYEEFKKMMK